MDSSKIPVNIITGFLGSGKTTAIIQLLQSKTANEKWAVIVNEFGKISIDFEFLAPHVSSNEKVFEISGGCICCSAKDYFLENLKEVVAQNKFDRIIVEPSGLGGVDMVSEQVKQLKNLEIMPIICLIAVDSINHECIQKNMIYQSQIRKSDILVISKCDTVNSEKKSLALLEMKQKYPGKMGYYTSEKGVLPKNIFIKIRFNMKNMDFGNFTYQLEELSDKNYQQKILTYASNVLFDIAKFKYELESHSGIIRAKGYLNTLNGCKRFHFVVDKLGFENAEKVELNKIVIIYENLQSFDESFLKASMLN